APRTHDRGEEPVRGQYGVLDHRGPTPGGVLPVRHRDQGPTHHGPGDRASAGVRVRRDERRGRPGHPGAERGGPGRPDPDGQRGEAPRGPAGRRWRRVRRRWLRRWGPRRVRRRWAGWPVLTGYRAGAGSDRPRALRGLPPDVPAADEGGLGGEEDLAVIQ